MPEKNYHHGDLKTQLILEGLNLLDKEGYENFSLRKVAQACGVSQTAPYRHFESKDALISAITQHALEAFGARLEAAVAKHPDNVSEQLREMGVAYIRFFAEKPEYLRLLFLSDYELRARFSQSVHASCHAHAEFVDRSFSVLEETVVRYKEAHPELSMSQEELALYSWGLVHGISTLIAGGELPNSEATLVLAERVIRSADFLK
jgi:AcrR family transcriptional regulator